MSIRLVCSCGAELNNVRDACPCRDEPAPPSSVCKCGRRVDDDSGQCSHPRCIAASRKEP